MNYFAVAAWFLTLLPESEDRKMFLEKSIFPIFEKYLRHTGEGVQSSISIQTPEVCAKGFKTLAQLRFTDIQGLLESEWRRLTELLIEDMRTPLPEQSKSFEKSQDSLTLEIKRWFSMQADLLKESDLPSFDLNVCMESSVCILNAAVEVLKSRNGLSELP
jgi:hypothetical protein